MRLLFAMLMAVAILAVSVGARAGDPDILAPYRFNPAPKEMTPLDKERALDYRMQVQRQLKEQERDDALGRLGPLGRRDLLDTRSEAERMDRITGAGTTGPAQFGTPLLPSMLPSLSH